jgi:hypothetical protein
MPLSFLSGFALGLMTGPILIGLSLVVLAASEHFNRTAEAWLPGQSAAAAHRTPVTCGIVPRSTIVGKRIGMSA